MDLDSIFDAFDEHTSTHDYTQRNERLYEFSSGKSLSQSIVAKVRDLLIVYKSFDAIQSEVLKQSAKDRVYKTYNNSIYELINQCPISNSDKVRGMAYAGGQDLIDILSTLTKAFERSENFEACRDIQSLREAIAFENVTRSLWAEQYVS